jgi:uncharacterized protein (DUF427 family)
MRRHRVRPGPGQESVWDYPRPPRLERSGRRVAVDLGGVRIVDTTLALRVLETSHPPVYYVPLADFTAVELTPTDRTSMCEFKGRARYWTLAAGGRVARDAAWSYPQPVPAFAALADHLAVYPSRMDACWVDGEQVQAQAGDFYGGWITSHVVGPFKGAPGTWRW